MQCYKYDVTHYDEVEDIEAYITESLGAGN